MTLKLSGVHDIGVLSKQVHHSWTSALDISILSNRFTVRGIISIIHYQAYVAPNVFNFFDLRLKNLLYSFKYDLPLSNTFICL